MFYCICLYYILVPCIRQPTNFSAVIFDSCCLCVHVSVSFRTNQAFNICLSKNFRISFSAGKRLHWKSKNGDLKISYTNCLILTLRYSSVTRNAYNLAPMFTKNRICYFKIVVTLHLIRIASINLNNVVKIEKNALVTSKDFRTYLLYYNTDG